ncbi:MAG: SDR family NAD(P)-dependent oxidoreductase, partial [Chloroflexota bacterium]
MGDRLAAKVAIVTGAGSGIGQASAMRFAAEGAAVVCADVRGPLRPRSPSLARSRPPSM